MTKEEEAQEFINKVKGKKIRWNNWCTGIVKYFIPNGEFDHYADKMYTFEGIIYYDDGQEYNSYYFVHDGLGDSNRCWSFYQDDTKTLREVRKVLEDPKTIKKHECHCDWTDVLRHGCKCGGV